MQTEEVPGISPQDHMSHGDPHNTAEKYLELLQQGIAPSQIRF